MKKSLLWLSAGMLFILALKAELPEISNYFSGKSTKQTTVSSQKLEVEAALPPTTIRYVTPSGASSKDGSSWANASDDVNLMIASSSSGDQIWVASGTYLPNFSNTPASSNPKNKTFYLKDGVKVYGGFNGTESNLADRDVTTNTTRLSGDFNGDDFVFNCADNLLLSSMDENAYHIVIADNVGPETRLDGFTISGGRTKDTTDFDAKLWPPGCGGGIFVDSSAVTIANCTLEGNYAFDRGAAIYLRHRFTGNVSPKVVNCTIKRNYTQKDGGGIYDSESGCYIADCFFECNYSFEGWWSYLFFV